LQLALALTLFAADRQTAHTTPETSAPQGSHETFKSEVLKVFSAKEGDALFRAYVVKWNGQEVIARDSLVRTDHRVGDTVTVLAMNQPFSQGKAWAASSQF